MTRRTRIERINGADDYRALQRPLYFAVEVDGDPGVFRCPALGELHYSESQVRQLADRIDCEVRLIHWSDCER